MDVRSSQSDLALTMLESFLTHTEQSIEDNTASSQPISLSATMPIIQDMSVPTLNKVVSKVQNKVMLLQADVKSKDDIILELNRQIDVLRTSKRDDIKRVSDEAKEDVKREHEKNGKTIEENHMLINQLLGEKERILDNFSTFTEKYKKEKDKLVSNHKKQMEEHLKKQKEAWAAAEKIRRDKWKEAKLIEIKASTLKSFEMEVQRIIDKSRDDVKKAHKEKDDALKRQQAIWDDSMSKQFDTVKSRLIQENEKDLAIERERCEMALREQSSRHEIECNELKRQIDTTISKEQLRLSHENEKNKFMLVQEIERLKLEHQKELSEINTRHSQLINELKHENNSKIQQLENSMKNRQDALLKETEDKLKIEREESEKILREELESKHGEEIEMLIDKLSQESAIRLEQAKSDFMRSRDSTAYKLKEELEASRKRESDILQRYRSIYSEHSKLDGEIDTVKSQLSASHLHIDELKNSINKLEKRISEQKQREDSLLIELQSARAVTSSAKGDYESALKTQQDSYDRRVADLDAAHSDILKKLQARVKGIIEQKDEKLASKDSIIEALQARIHSTESVLKQQYNTILEQ